METVKKQISYTTINHVARKELGLSWLEYGLADLVYNLSNNPKSDYPTWCYASKQFLATNLGVTKQSIHSLINKLINKKILERHPETKHLKITIDWYTTVIIKGSKDALPAVKEIDTNSKESLPQDSKETLHNKEIVNKDKNKDQEKESKKEKEQSLAKASSLPPTKYPHLEDLTETDFEEIANRYQVPISFVRSKFDDMVLWAEERPNNQKLKGRNWRATLMKWVKRDAFDIRERSKGDPTKRAVDARNL